MLHFVTLCGEKHIWYNIGMKKLLILGIIITFASTAFAELPERKFKNLPEGTFRKTRSGKIVQYDKNGKKVGVYNLNSKRLTKRK